MRPVASPGWRISDIFLYSPCDLYSKMKMSSVLPVSVMTSTEVGLKQPDFQYLPALCRRGKSWVLRQVLSRWTSGEKRQSCCDLTIIEAASVSDTDTSKSEDTPPWFRALTSWLWKQKSQKSKRRRMSLLSEDFCPDVRSMVDKRHGQGRILDHKVSQVNPFKFVQNHNLETLVFRWKPYY